MSRNRSKSLKSKRVSSEDEDGTVLDEMKMMALLAKNKEITRAYAKEKKEKMELAEQNIALRNELVQEKMQRKKISAEYESICQSIKSAAPTMIEVVSLFIQVSGRGNSSAKSMDRSATEPSTEKVSAHNETNGDTDYGDISMGSSRKRRISDEFSDSDTENKSSNKSSPRNLSTILEESALSAITVRATEKNSRASRSSLFCNANDSLADFSQFSPQNSRHSTQISRLSVRLERFDDPNKSLIEKTITPYIAREDSKNVSAIVLTPETGLGKVPAYLPTPSMSCLGDIDPNTTPTKMFGDNLLPENPPKKSRSLKTSTSNSLRSLQDRLSTSSYSPKEKDTPQVRRPLRAAKPKVLKEVSLRKKLRRT